jgi:hypothetical protein
MNEWYSNFFLKNFKLYIEFFKLIKVDRINNFFNVKLIKLIAPFIHSPNLYTFFAFDTTRILIRFEKIINKRQFMFSTNNFWKEKANYFFFFTKTIKVEFLNIFNFKTQLHKLILSINCSSKNIETSLNEKNKKLRMKLVNFDIFIKHFDRYMYSTIKKTFKKAKNTFFFAVDSVWNLTRKKKWMYKNIYNILWISKHFIFNLNLIDNYNILFMHHCDFFEFDMFCFIKKRIPFDFRKKACNIKYINIKKLKMKRKLMNI